MGNGLKLLNIGLFIAIAILIVGLVSTNAGDETGFGGLSILFILLGLIPAVLGLQIFRHIMSKLDKPRIDPAKSIIAAVVLPWIFLLGILAKVTIGDGRIPSDEFAYGFMIPLTLVSLVIYGGAAMKLWPETKKRLLVLLALPVMFIGIFTINGMIDRHCNSVENTTENCNRL